MIRWPGVIFLAVLIVLSAIMMWIFTDSWLEDNLESTGSAIVGAKVEFDDVRFSLADLHISWARLQVTDPDATMQNMIETAACEFDLSIEALAQKKFVLENFQLTGLQLGTDRETDGALSEEELAELREQPDFIKSLQEELASEKEHMPIFNLASLSKNVNVDSIYALLELESPAKLDSTTSHTKERYTHWTAQLGTLPGEAELSALEKDIRALDPAGIDDVASLKSALDQTGSLYDRVTTAKNSVSEMSDQFQEDLKHTLKLREQAPEWIKQDYQRALSKAQLPDFSVENVARLLFGERILDRMHTISGYIGTMRHYAHYFQGAVPADESPPRLEGIDIHFSQMHSIPAFWIQNIDLSGQTPDGLSLSGAAKHIVSDQQVIGEPTTLSLAGTNSQGGTLNLDGLFDYRNETEQEKITLNAFKVPLTNVTLSPLKILPSKIESGNANIAASLEFGANSFTSKIGFDGSNIQFGADDDQAAEGTVAQIRNRLKSAVSNISFEAVTAYIDGDFKFSISSNLDNMIADEMKALAGAEIEKARTEIEGRIDVAVAGPKEQLESNIAALENDITAKLSVVDQQLAEYTALIDQYKKQLEDEIKNKAGNKVKDLLNFP